jgi:hypothetical protein
MKLNKISSALNKNNLMVCSAALAAMLAMPTYAAEEKENLE